MSYAFWYKIKFVTTFVGLYLLPLTVISIVLTFKQLEPNSFQTYFISPLEEISSYSLVSSAQHSTRHPGIILDFWPCQSCIWWLWFPYFLNISSPSSFLLLTLFIQQLVTEHLLCSRQRIQPGACWDFNLV